MQVNNIKLNLLPRYYMFYDWLKNDNIKTYQKVSLYRVSNITFNDFINYNVKILDESIYLENNPVIFSDSYSYVAIMFDKDGNSYLKSSLLLEDELKLSSKVDDLKLTKIIYSKSSEVENDNELRLNTEIKKIILKEINSLEKNNNIEKIKYLYYEWFNKNTDNLSLMIKNMKNKIDKEITSKEIYIYGLIQKCYRTV